MSSELGLSVRRKSATPASATEIRRDTVEIAKVVDIDLCIGCKACEVACKEWNDLPAEETHNFGSYQSHQDLTAATWDLMRFKEVELDDGDIAWLIRKDSCLHCDDPGCLAACPAPGAIVQYTNGIVDFNQDQCIGCGYCITGCPFDVPKIHAKTRRVYKCTMCVDRVSVGLQPACVKACPTSCLQFGTKDAMLEIANTRVAQLQANGFPDAAVYDPPGVGGTGVVTVLAFGSQPELYGLPKDPVVPRGVQVWKGAVKSIG